MGVSTLKVSDGAVISHKRKKANVLNDHFFSVFTRNNDRFQQTQPETPSSYPIMSNINITREGIRHLLEKLKVYKSPGPDGITTRVLKELLK